MGEKGAKANPGNEDLVERVLGELHGIGDISSKKMFGGHGLFEGGAMFGLVTAKGILHLKVDDSNREQFEQAGSERMGKMPYYAVPADVLEDPAVLRDWSKQSMNIAREAKK